MLTSICGNGARKRIRDKFKKESNKALISAKITLY